MTLISLARAGLTGAGLLLATWLPGWAAGLNDTGVTQCANLTQNNLTCPQAGFPSQDAETGRDAQQTAGSLSKAGSGSAGFDFTKLDSTGAPLPTSAPAWDCMRDNVTGLIWEIKTDDNGLRDKDWTYTWYNPDPATNGGHAGSLGSNNCGGTLPSNQCNTWAYVTAVNALSPALCGYTDWRLPTMDELRSIVDHSRQNPTIGAAYFPQTVSYYFWSASPYAPYAGDAWNVNFSNGYDYAYDKGNRFAVRLARGGQSLALETTPTSDFTLDDVNGVAYHKTTGLTWKRCAEGQSWDSVNKTCMGTATTYTWSAALSLASGDWRLPNINELRSLVEQRRWNPAINPTVFPNTSTNWFWSASPCASVAGHAWVVNFNYGDDSASNEGDSDAVRLVRGGQYSLLSVTKAGGGSGAVASSLPGVECGKYCKGSFADEMFAAGQVVLIATPVAGSSFGSWANCPSASGNRCTVNSAGDRTVTATFTAGLPGGLALAGLTALADGQIYYTTNLTTWVNIPGALNQLQVGDFNGDSQTDLAGVGSNGSLWYTTNRSTWTQIPGALSRIVVANFNGDGYADLAGLASNGTIWYTTNLNTWTQIPGALSRIVVANFNGDGYADLAGLASNGTTWYTTNLNTWTQIPGALSQLVAGDLDGDGYADLAGLASNGTIWYTTSLGASWTNISGALSQLVAGDLNGDGQADLAGLASNGSIWYTTNLSTWTQIPGQLSQLRTANLNDDGKADLAGIASDNTIWYTINLGASWTNIRGQLAQLAGD